MKVKLADEFNNPLPKEIQEMRLASRGILNDYVYDEGTGFYIMNVEYNEEV